jgi:hypothetical protein
MVKNFAKDKEKNRIFGFYACGVSMGCARFKFLVSGFMG